MLTGVRSRCQTCSVFTYQNTLTCTKSATACRTQLPNVSVGKSAGKSIQMEQIWFIFGFFCAPLDLCVCMCVRVLCCFSASVVGVEMNELLSISHRSRCRIYFVTCHNMRFGSHGIICYILIEFTE